MTAHVDAVLEAVSRQSGYSPEELRGHGRERELLEARAIAMHLVRATTDLGLVPTGRAFGGRDHTTILHACRKVAARMAIDPEYRALVLSLSARLGRVAYGDPRTWGSWTQSHRKGDRGGQWQTWTRAEIMAARAG